MIYKLSRIIKFCATSSNPSVINGFNIILSRFSINDDNLYKFNILFPKQCLIKVGDNYNISISDKNKFFILIAEYKKCIEVGFNENRFVYIDNCYIFDEYDKY